MSYLHHTPARWWMSAKRKLKKGCRWLRFQSRRGYSGVISNRLSRDNSIRQRLSLVLLKVVKARMIHYS
ncbi:hypothetical protein PILCRDRAFT_829728 [Piloderma croceum F 1598]|uniref:Uncharacterized protein n=1 Tax=Piloderma croceum (strain F 1598) TaxID=765440 RepID=A0A0C3EWT0_PILCF|nr:hypothetical protein PILCRDRAFT_829728 [Piloderma croceum F 1598]